MATDEPAGRGTVLVVDDEPGVLLATQTILEDLGFPVVTAGTGDDALSTFREHADVIGAVLLDLGMPDLSGGEVCRRLREIDPEVRVIVTSGYTPDEVSQELDGADVAGFVQKPYRAAELADHVRAALESRHRD